MAPDITSPSNERIKWLVRLRQRRHRDAEGLFVVEGERLYRRALQSGLEPVLSFVAAGSAIVTAGETLTVDPIALDKASYRDRSQDVIGVFSQMDVGLGDLRVPEAPLILVAESIEKPGNLGAMLRTGSAAGADALIAVDGGVDAHNPNVVRSSTGALFTVPLALTSWDELEPWLRTRGIRIIGASPRPATTLWETDLSGSLALVVGTEDEGLSGRAEGIVDATVQIPQDNTAVDSLNVSVAAAILLFEARRQRSLRH